MELVERRGEVHWLWKHFLVSQRRVCDRMGVTETSQRYVSQRNDAELRERLIAAAREKPKWGYRRLQVKLEGQGMRVNHKRVYRVYREAGLLIRRKRRKRLLRVGFVRPAVTGANQEWALDFVHDAAESGRKFRVLSVIDVYTRECLVVRGRHRLSGTADDASVGCDRGGTWKTTGDSLGQRAGVHLTAFSGLGAGAADRSGAHRAGEAGAERARGKFPREIAR